MLGPVGATATETSAAGVTVNVSAGEVMPPKLAVMDVVPMATAAAIPLVPVALLTVAVAGTEEVQVTLVVMFCVELSLNVPVATNCLVVPFATLGEAGVTAMDRSVAGVTVRITPGDVTVPRLAVIDVVPAATAVTTPFDPVTLLIVAVAGTEDVQVTLGVRFWVELSLYVPVAANCCVVPLAILGTVGVTAIETKAAGVTVSWVEPEMLPSVAVTMVDPTVSPVATPVAATDATVGVEVLQATAAVRFCFELSEYMPVAVNGFIVPRAMLGVVGVTSMEARVGACGCLGNVSVKMYPAAESDTPIMAVFGLTDVSKTARPDAVVPFRIAELPEQPVKL
jgi:hypothetical protein